MAGQFEPNIQLDSEFTYQQYSPPLSPSITTISGTATGGAVTNIDGDSGGGAVGPIITQSGGVTGYTFQAVGTTITMLGNSATILAALGIAKQNSSASPPSVNDDSSLGYAPNSLWVEANTKAYICVDSTVGAAVWTQIAP